MALTAFPKLPVTPPPTASSPRRLPPTLSPSTLHLKPPRAGRYPYISHTRPPTRRNKWLHNPNRALEESQGGAEPQSEEEAKEEASKVTNEEDISTVGEEIKRAMAERKEKEGQVGANQLLSGVAKEIGEIEWPAFGKVLGTTGVVLGVIAGSSVVLLTVNAVLAELSDRVFAGRGVQDFFG